MTENYIQFKRQRELGDIITDTFKFLRENYKHLFKLIFSIAGPAFLVLLLALTYYSYLSLDTLENSLFEMAEALDVGTYLITGAILLFSMLAFYVFLYGTVFHFINSYIKNNGTVIDEEVRQGVKYDFGNLLGLLVLCGIILFFGLILCFFPGVYLWVPISIAPAVMVFGRYSSITDSIGEAFNLIKNNWWMTFFTLVVMTILVYMVGLIFQIPLFIYYFVKSFTMVQEGSAADPSTLFDWVYVVFNVISNIAQYILSTIILVATAFIYYDLNEKKNFTGTYETISNLGSSENK